MSACFAPQRCSAEAPAGPAGWGPPVCRKAACQEVLRSMSRAAARARRCQGRWPARNRPANGRAAVPAAEPPSPPAPVLVLTPQLSAYPANTRPEAHETLYSRRALTLGSQPGGGLRAPIGSLRCPPPRRLPQPQRRVQSHPPQPPQLRPQPPQRSQFPHPAVYLVPPQPPLQRRPLGR